MVAELNYLMETYATKIDFMVAYVAEAHAEDEWPIGSDTVVFQHKTIEDRQRAAYKCIEETGIHWPIVLDTLSNEFTEKYGAWPIRFFIFDNQEKKMVWQSFPQNGGYYYFDELMEFLGKFLED